MIVLNIHLVHREICDVTVFFDAVMAVWRLTIDVARSTTDSRSGVPRFGPTKHLRWTADGSLLTPDGRYPSRRGVLVVVKKLEDVPEGYQVIFRPWITLRNGKRLYAATCGLTAFRLVVRK